MDKATAQKIREALGKSDSVGIIVAPDPSIDIMAAGLSVYLLLKQANKKVSIACPTEPIVELSSLVGIDKVQPGLGGEAGDLVVSFPYVDGEIDKVSYTIEDGFLNIIVKAGEKGISFEDQDIRYSKGSGPIDLLFVIGTPKLDEIRDIFDTEKLRETRIINIDNKQENQGYGDIVVVSPRFSSISEQVADLALALGMEIEHDIAQNLLSGIINGTKNFQNANTSPLAFETASLLMKKGASRGRNFGQGGRHQPAEEIDRVADAASKTDPFGGLDSFDTYDEPRDQRKPDLSNLTPQQSHQQNLSHLTPQLNRMQKRQQPSQDRGGFDQDEQQQRIQRQLHEEDELDQSSEPEEVQTKPDPTWLRPKVYSTKNQNIE